ncbi:uncharacterized protein LOC117267587 isoform X2 [Epinephelus lanceolatus]
MDCTSIADGLPPHTVTKYIVNEDMLMELFKKCPVCTRSCIISRTVIGTLLQVNQSCPHCEYAHQWSSQPMVNNIPAGNLQLCAAVLFTGSSFVKISKFLEAFKTQGISETTFHKHQANLLFPTINWMWHQNQDDLIRETIAGHSAKYGSYTMMDLKTNKVIDIQLVQSNEVGNSCRMEKEGFQCSLSLLEHKGVTIKAIVTDRHPGIQKYMREQRHDITHYFDPWHMGKGIGKKMDVLAKVRRMQDVGLWKKSIVNHLYWSASTSASGEEVVAKWSSVANHIQNVHIHDNTLFPTSLHQPLVGEQARQWLKPSTAACEKLTAILLSTRLLKDMEKISPQYHTSQIECFHSFILKFAPKNVVFSYTGMLCRLQLMAMHCNENATRVHSSTTAGELRYSITYLKYKHGDFMMHQLKSYIDALMELLFHNVVEDLRPYQELLDKIPVPEPLCAQFTRPDNKPDTSPAFPRTDTDEFLSMDGG